MVAVFDGHGGNEASEYVSTAVENHILYYLESGEKKLSEILKKSFDAVDKAFYKYLYHNFIGKNTFLIFFNIFYTV